MKDKKYKIIPRCKRAFDNFQHPLVIKTMNSGYREIVPKHGKGHV